jgi:Holliday junction resolvase RusA-like endonuclease
MMMSAEGELFAVSFAVPGAPRGKGRPRTAVIHGRAQIYTDAKTRSEEGAIRSIAAGAMAAAGKQPFDGAVVLRLCAYRPIPSGFSQRKREAAERGEIVPITKPDADNYLKMVDALNGIIWRDDSQVVTAVIHKRYSDRPRLVVDVRSAPTS